MSAADLAWSAAWLAAAAVACARLLRAASQPDASVKNGCRWLAVAAACLAAGAAGQLAFGGLIGGAQPLRLADLVSLAALPALIIGLATLTGPAAAGSGGDASDRPGPVPAGAAEGGSLPGIVTDSCLLVVALFAICLVSMFGPDYATADVGRAAFALALVRPVADLAALGIVLRFAVRSPRMTLLPVLALVAVAIGDALAVGDRIAGQPPGAGARTFLVIALALLALGSAAAPGPVLRLRAGLPGIADRAPWPGAQWPDALPGAWWSSPATIAALATTTVAALVVTGYALAGVPVSAPLLAIAGSVAVLLLVARLAALARRASAVAASALESDGMFRSLADATSDAILTSDLAGVIEHASQAVAEFGYLPRELTGQRLADLVHPEDRQAGIRAALTGMRGAAGSGSFAGRVRGADGSWRYVEATLSRYGQAGVPARMLVTARDVSDRVALRHQVNQLTFHDSLTGLPNRAYVEDLVKELTTAAGQGGVPAGPAPDGAVPEVPAAELPAAELPAADVPAAEVTAILVDLDGFSAVNELVGATGADLMLAQVGRRVRAAVPPPATVGRWGSDEFAILWGSGQAVAEAAELAERVAGQIAAEPFSVGGKEIPMTVSVGVATCGAAEAVLGNASFALSRAKEAGGGRVEVFAPKMSEQALRRAALADELRQAIARGELAVEFRPIVEIATARVRDMQAVVTWPGPPEPGGPSGHGDQGELAAAVADRGLDAQIGSWALQAGCAQLARWRCDGWPVGLSLRCPPGFVTAPRFVASVLAALEEADVPPQALTLEISERTLLDPPGQVAADLAGLRRKGIRLAIGDFGTGYAAIAGLRRSSVDVIKIAPSLVAGLDADPTLDLLVETIVRFAGELGIDVVADGIDEPGQRDRLAAMGCRLGQGSAVGGPAPGRDPAPVLATGLGAPPAPQHGDR